jgi:CcmD family protein
MSRIARWAGWGVGVVIAMPGRALAQAQSQGFVPATDIARETLPALPLLYVAYAFVWVALIAYVFLLWRRIGKVERELTEVTKKLGSRR